MLLAHYMATRAILDDFFKIVSLIAFFGIVYLLLGVAVALWFSRKKFPAPAANARSVSMLKPLHGQEPNLSMRLAAYCAQNYSGEMQIVFGCSDQDDPAIPIVKSLQKSAADTDVQLVVNRRIFGVNRKVSNLMNMFEQSQGELVAISDSDIEVTADYLTNVLSPLEDEQVGGVTCLYHGLPGETFGSACSALALNSHFLPSVIVAIKTKLATPCFGSTIAMRRETLSKIGGFAAFKDQLADDYAIGQAIRDLGLRVVIPPFTLGHVCHDRSFKDFFHHQLRFNRTIRSINPLGYLGAVIGNPLPFALLTFFHGGSPALFLAGAAIGGRIALCKTVERVFSLPRQPLWLLPIVDLFLFSAFVCSYFGADVTWRGQRYKVISNGVLSQDEGRPTG